MRVSGEALKQTRTADLFLTKEALYLHYITQETLILRGYEEVVQLKI